MAATPRNFALVKDGETLLKLDGGVELIRREKHEPKSLEGLNRDERRRATDKENGSKFAADWTLERYVLWLAAFVQAAEWRFPPSDKAWAQVRMQAEIGVAEGNTTHTIEVVRSGRYVHAYPIPD